MPDATIPGLDALLEHRSWVRDIARRLVRDAAEAEDLAQEAWVRVMRSPPDPDRDPRPWLRRVLKNLASNRWRGERRRTAREHAWRDQRAQRTPAELVEEADQHQRLVRRVLELEEPFKTTLVLRFYEGLSPREIAERLGIAEGTVHSRVARAVERLRDRLDDEAGGDRKRWIAALLPLARLGTSAPAATATATSLTGVLLMVTKSKLAVLTTLALLAVAAGGVWLAADSDVVRPESDPPAGRDVASAPTLQGSGRELRPDEAAATAVQPSETRTRASLLRGRVVDTQGAPVAGAEVFLQPESVSGLDDDQLTSGRLAFARTDADGQFLLESARGMRHLVAHAEGRLPASLLVNDVSGDEAVELVLGEARTVTVRVDAPDGRWPPLCGLSIRTDGETTWDRTSDPRKLGHYDHVAPEGEPRDAERIFRVPTLAPLAIYVSPPPGWAALPRRILLPAEGDEAAFRLVPSGVVHLSILDASTGEALSEDTEVHVAIVDAAAPDHPLTRSAPIHYLDLESGLSPGSYRIEVTVGGYLPATRTFEMRSPGEQAELVVALEPRYAADVGGVLVRVVDGASASDAVRALARSGAPPGFASEYVAFIRAAGTTEWIGTNAEQRPDGRIELRPDLLEKWQTGVAPGTYDLYLARRDTGTAAFYANFRVFGGQENEITVDLAPGSLFRVTDLLPGEEQLANLEVRAKGLGQLPMIEWRRDGHWTLTGTADVENLLRVPLEPTILGPFPASEVEVRIETSAGAKHVVRVRGAKVLR